VQKIKTDPINGRRGTEVIETGKDGGGDGAKGMASKYG
jgi:hypothetical protein